MHTIQNWWSWHPNKNVRNIRGSIFELIFVIDYVYFTILTPIIPWLGIHFSRGKSLDYPKLKWQFNVLRCKRFSSNKVLGCKIQASWQHIKCYLWEAKSTIFSWINHEDVNLHKPCWPNYIHPIWMPNQTKSILFFRWNFSAYTMYLYFNLSHLSFSKNIRGMCLFLKRCSQKLIFIWTFAYLPFLQMFRFTICPKFDT